MKKCILLFFLVLLIATPIFAQSSNDPSKYFQSYLENGDLSIYASIGWFWGFCLNGGAELVLGQWNIADIVPIDFSVGVRVLYEGWSIYSYSYYYFGASPMFIIHIGTTGNLDFYEGIGLGFCLTNDTGLFLNGFSLGFSAVSGVAWYLSKNLGLILEYAYVGYASTWGVGITLKL
ncbi:MAG TPA: hypothetical protein PLF21_01445 [Exilispira sp.]|nr:hypothetical protein [Exilispira sp.]